MAHAVKLTAAERVLVHLHGLLKVREASPEATQAGIADGAQILRSHVPRTLKALQEEGLVESREARILGRMRKTTVYGLTPSGVARARELVDGIDAIPVDVDGRRATLGETRRTLGLSPLMALAAVDAQGRFRAEGVRLEQPTLLQREEDLAFLKRWKLGGAPLAVVYGSKGMGKTALGSAFARTVAGSAWISEGALRDLESLAAAVAEATGARATDPRDPESVAEAILAAFDRVPLLVLDGYGEVAEGIVDALAAFVRRSAGHPKAKLLVLAQESTPAYCRFYSRKDVMAGTVAERHLRGLDLEGCRILLGNPRIREEDLRRIYLLTKGCPLYLQYIREGDDTGLRQSSRFTQAEIRLLLYSRGEPT